MADPSLRPRRRHTTFLLRQYATPDQGELGVIKNAILAALEYSPLMSAPRDRDDVYAHVSSEIERRFWKDIYVERPQIREILLTLETGQLVLVTGECGTGKSTAIEAVVQELTPGSERSAPDQDYAASSDIIPCVLDANVFTEELRDPANVSATVHRELFQDLLAKLRARLDGEPGGRGAWLTYLHQTHGVFELFRDSVETDGLSTADPEDAHYLAAQPDYAPLIAKGQDAFSQLPHSDRLRALLAFIGERTSYEPLLVVDNVDHLGHDSARSCGDALFAILTSSSHRVRGAIAVRPETADAIQHALDTAVKPARVSMMQRSLNPNEYEQPSIDITLRFLEKRLAVLREPETVAIMLAAIDKTNASRLTGK